MTTRAIEAVLFDLDGTLYDRDRLAAELFAAQYAAFAHELTGISRERFMLDVLAMDEHGHGSKESGHPALARSWGMEAELAALGIEHAFDTILVSEEEGVRKPNAEIFRRALARLRVEAGNAMFVGDHPVAESRVRTAPGCSPYGSSCRIGRPSCPRSRPYATSPSSWGSSTPTIRDALLPVRHAALLGSRTMNARARSTTTTTTTTRRWAV